MCIIIQADRLKYWLSKDKEEKSLQYIKHQKFTINLKLESDIYNSNYYCQFQYAYINDLSKLFKLSECSKEENCVKKCNEIFKHEFFDENIKLDSLYFKITAFLEDDGSEQSQYISVFGLPTSKLEIKKFNIINSVYYKSNFKIVI